MHISFIGLPPVLYLLRWSFCIQFRFIFDHLQKNGLETVRFGLSHFRDFSEINSVENNVVVIAKLLRDKWHAIFSNDKEQNHMIGIRAKFCRNKKISD